MELLDKRKKQIYRKGQGQFGIECNKHSLAGSVSQRACVFCGSRVVLYPIADALHLIHGPVGCAVYTWDIRGALSSGPQIHRLSFTTDLNEHDVIYGGEKKLGHVLQELIEKYKPNGAFVYSTCIVGLIGDDVDAVCKKASEKYEIPVLPVNSVGFAGTKKDGYAAACDALLKLVGTDGQSEQVPYSINILGDFNLAGEIWMLKGYYEKMGINVVATITGDGRIAQVRKAHTAQLNLVQCSGSMIGLAKEMEKKYGIPYKRVSYFGIEDMSSALYEVASFFQNEEILDKTRALVSSELQWLMPKLRQYAEALNGKKAAIYVGGAFKAISLIKALRHLNMGTVVVGSQTGNQEDYALMKELADEDAILVDDANPVELSTFVMEKGADLFIGGVKERPIAYKLGLGFCDHNHERKEALAGFQGMLNFAREVYSSTMSPVWKYVRMNNQWSHDE